MRVFQCDRCGQQDKDPGSYRNKRKHAAIVRVDKVDERGEADEYVSLQREICVECLTALEQFMNPPKAAVSP